jgi:DNA-3-methyladenine glycosylase II
MLTGEFETGLAELRGLLANGTVALMCAEAVPWRCHRSLIADALTVRGARVEHITGPQRSTLHHLTDFAEVEDTRVTYPDLGSRLDTPAPFHLEATVRVLQRRPTNLVDVWEDARYLRVLTVRDDLVLVEVMNQGTIDEPRVRFRILEGDDSRQASNTISNVLRRVLGLDVNPGPLERALQAERRLSPIALALRGMRPPRFPSLMETFANVIPFQQVSLDAGVAMVRRLVERFGRSLRHGGQDRYAFPTAAALAAARLDALRACGLSTKKAEALRGAAAALEAGELTEAALSQLSSVEAMRLLAGLRGIGPWSAALILLRGLGRLDVFPDGDVGAARGLTGMMHVQRGPALDRVIRRFGDQRGYLYFCSLGNALLARGLIRGDAAPPRRGRKQIIGVKPGMPPALHHVRRRRSLVRLASSRAGESPLRSS